MKKIETDFEGLFILETKNFEDPRGSFQKLFNFSWFEDNELQTDFKEFYYSVSHENVIRGMHFQLPPQEHAKVVYVSMGQITDVVLDLRASSATFGSFFSINLDDRQGRYLYIPAGFAHGFTSLVDNTVVNYAQTSVYCKEADAGILFDSFGFEWNVKTPVLSERDNSFPSFENFKSPF